MTALTAPEATTPRRSAWSRLLQHPTAVLGLIIILMTVLGAALAPWIAPFDPAEQFFDGLTIEGAPLPPGGAYHLGTDLLGRDLLSRGVLV